MSTNEPQATVQSVRSQLASLAAPLRKQYRDIEITLRIRQREIAELRALRTEVRNALRTVDPTFVAPGQKTTTKKKKSGSTGFQPDSPKLHEIAEWLRANAEEFNGNGGFYASDISKRPDAPVTQSRMNKALVALHEQGVIRLDRKEGLMKFYKVVA